MQCKDIPDQPIIDFFYSLNGAWGTWFNIDSPNTVVKVFPPNTPDKLVRSKMKSLDKKGFITGCHCGCRGDYELTSKTIDEIKFKNFLEDK